MPEVCFSRPTPVMPESVRRAFDNPIPTTDRGQMTAARSRCGPHPVHPTSPVRPTSQASAPPRNSASAAPPTNSLERGETTMSLAFAPLDQAVEVDVEVPCRRFDPDLWFADSPAELELAKSMCLDCPVRVECLAGALDRSEPWGVWGGEIFDHGVVIARKRPRGRPRKADLARDAELARSQDFAVLAGSVA